MALACFGLTNKAQADRCLHSGKNCSSGAQCCSGVCKRGKFYSLPGVCA
jgi:hypothetical protein